MASADDQEIQVTLHWLEKSRSQRILWLLEELQVPYALKTYKRGGDMLAPPELKSVHPLGKSPVIGVRGPGAEQERIIAESGAIVEYLIEHFDREGKWKTTRYRDGMEGRVGGETEEWTRERFYMHYAEGSLMSIMVIGLVIANIKNAPVPFFLKPITRSIAARVEDGFLNAQYELHFSFLEEQLSSSPGDGAFFCGANPTGADALMIFPLEAAKTAGKITAQKYPRLSGYVDMIQAREAYKKAVQRIIDETGEYSMKL